MVSIKYPFPPVIFNVGVFVTSIIFNVGVFVTLERVVYKSNNSRLSKCFGIHVYKVEKLYVWTDVAVRTSIWSREESSLVEFLTKQKHLIVYRTAGFLIFKSFLDCSRKQSNCSY